MSNKTMVWKQASEVYADISELTPKKAIAHLFGIKNIASDVREAVITLINSSSQASQYFSDEISANYNIEFEQQNFKTGQKLDEYELLEELGKGGMSQVFKAKRITTQQQTHVAIKIFAPRNNPQNLLTHFIKEQKILADLSHPHIVKMLHGGMTGDDIAYLVMELIEQAQPLDQYCQKNKLNTHLKIKLIAQCADALAYSHANLIIHRDLKPDNILINKNKKLKVVDFGIAKLINNDIPGNKTTTFALTPNYASPEQINSKPIGIKTDIFSLAVVALDLLSEGNPLPKDRLLKSCANDELHINQVIKSLNTDKDLKNIITTGLQQKPELRYATMNDFAEDLQAWLKGLPVAATGNSLYYQVMKFAQRRKALFASLATLFITLVLSVIALSWQYRQTVIENRKAVEIKDFMLDIFSYADPESSLGTQLNAIDLLNFANEKIVYKTFSNPEVKADILTNIGTSLLNLGSDEKGEKLLLDAIYHKPDGLKAQLRLAQLYAQSNQLEKAKGLIAQLEGKIANNANHAQLNLELNLLKAIVLKFKGKYQQAQNLALFSYEKFTQSKNHRGVLKSTRFLSDIYIQLGKNQSAVDIIQAAKKFVEKEISPATPELLRLNIRHANLLSVLENHEQAIRLIGQTIVSIEKKLGENHPLIILAIAEKAGILRFAKNPIKAYEEAKKSHVIAVSKYGKNSKLAQNSLYVMADIQYSQGKYDEALSKFETIAKNSKVNYGEHNFITIISEINLANMYFFTGQQDRAIDYANSMRKKTVNVFGTQHELSIQAVNAYLEILIKRNEVTTQAQKISQENFDLSKTNLSTNHQQTQYSKRVLNRINAILEQGQ